MTQLEEKQAFKKSRENFRELSEALRKAGYRVKEKRVTNLVLKRGKLVNKKIKKQRVAIVSGKSIRCIFATYGAGKPTSEAFFNWTSVDDVFDGMLLAENARCFDKWSKAPMAVDMVTCNNLEQVIKLLAFLGSDEGHRISNEYLYLDKETSPFPCEWR